jgi:hypothetical protein
MSVTLAQLVTKLQALLIGSATTITTATCTAGIRQTLLKMNLAIPMHAAETLDAVSEQYEYEIAEGTALEIVDVLLQGTDTYNDYNISLPFDAYFEDDRPFFRLRSPQASGSTLIARYTMPYTINGLDSATVSTLPALYDVVLLDGAAWQTCLVLAAGHVETINMNDDVTDKFTKMAGYFRTAFEAGLANLGRRPFPRSEPSSAAWVDEWQGQF